MINIIKKYFNLIQDRPMLACLFFCLLSILLRWPSFHFSVIDHDESTYIIIADAINNGQKLYTDVIDTKPAGIFLIFSFIQILFGKSIIALRLFSAIVLGISGFLIYRISLRFKLNSYTSIFNGMVFIIAFSAYRMGLSINTELYFTFFTLFGGAILFKAEEKKQYLLWLLGGLLIGIAFIIKYVVLAGFGAFCLFFLFQSIQKRKTLQSILFLIVSSIGLFIPFLLLHFYFYSVGRFDDFYYATYEVVSRYSSTFSITASLSFFVKFHLSFLPFIIPFYWALASKEIPTNLKILSVCWYCFAWVMVILPGKDFKHYYLQLLPSICLLIPTGIMLIIDTFNALKHHLKILAFLLTAMILSATINQSYFFTQQDIPRSIVKDIETNIQSNDIIWVDKKYHITYYLLGLKPPTEYIHPSLMFEHTKAFQIDTQKEAKRILDQEPAFIIHRKHNAFFLNFQRIQEEYEFFKSYGKVQVLKRKVSSKIS